MTTTYTLSTTIRIKMILAVLFPLSLMMALAFSQNPKLDANSFLGCLYLSPIIVFVYLAAYHSYISIDESRLTIVKLFVARTKIPINTIYSLKHTYTMVGFAQGIDVHYKSVNGKETTAGMPMIGFSIAAILHQLLEHNFSIKMDHKVQQLKENQGNGWHGQRDMTP